jgi:hypothetical protein
MGVGNGAPAWPSVTVSNGGISPSDHNIGQVAEDFDVSATFDLHNLAALRCTSGLGLNSAARTLFDAQEHPLLGKIKALEVV